MIRLYEHEDTRLHIDITKAGISIQRKHKGVMLYWSKRVSFDGWTPYRQTVRNLGRFTLIIRHGVDARKFTEVPPGANKGEPQLTLTIEEMIGLFPPNKNCKHCIYGAGKIRTIVSSQGVQARNDKTLPIRGHAFDNKRATVLCSCVLNQYHVWAQKNEQLNVEEVAPADNDSEFWYWCRLHGRRMSARACFLCRLDLTPTMPRMDCVNKNGYRII